MVQTSYFLVIISRIYQYSSGSWSQLGSDIDGEAAGDYAGYSVSLSSDGTKVAIGAYLNDGTGSNAGHTRIYQYSSGSWSQLGSDIDGAALNDGSGRSVSLSSDGDIVAIGDLFSVSRIYDYDGTSWNQLGNDIPGGDGELSGDGNTVATSSGSIYSYNGTSWNQLGNNILGGPVSISDDGNTVSVGIQYIPGIVGKIYSYNGTSWNQLGNDILDSTFYGYTESVSLSGDGNTVAIGDPENDASAGSGSAAGHVRVYQIGSNCSGCTDPTACNYDSTAIINNGSCLTAYGCIDSSATNYYNPLATVDDGSCNYTSQPMANLFFSEYAEGSSNNKYFEIYNPTSDTVDLTNYAFARVSKSLQLVGVYEFWVDFDSAAIILPNDVYVVAHPSADSLILARS